MRKYIKKFNQLIKIIQSTAYISIYNNNINHIYLYIKDIQQYELTNQGIKISSIQHRSCIYICHDVQNSFISFSPPDILVNVT